MAKLHVIDYGANADLPQSVRDAIPDDGVQTVFRQLLNHALNDGKSEMHAFLLAWKGLSAAGFHEAEGKWVAKTQPAVGDVHVDRPLGGKKPKEKDDPGGDPADVEEFEEESDSDELDKKHTPWIGVDLDGTLAEHTDSHDVIGAPVPKMIDRVKAWIAEGKTVKILTARVADDPDGKHKKQIKQWLKENLGQKLKVTATKDPDMTALYDDRAHGVNRNQGTLKAYVPPDEVRRAAKSAWDAGNAVLDVTAPLAEGTGLGIAEVRKIAAHFSDTSALTESDVSRNAWGGPDAESWSARVLRKYSADQSRAADGEFGEGGSGSHPVTLQPSPRMQRAMAAQVKCGKDEQKAADEQERIISKALGMSRTPDNSAFDLQNPPNAVEIKTMLSSKNGKVTMSKSAIARKTAEISKSGLTSVHTVVADKRGGSTKYYIAKGVGSFRVSAMTPTTLAGIRAAVHG